MVFYDLPFLPVTPDYRLFCDSFPRTGSQLHLGSAKSFISESASPSDVEAREAATCLF